MKMFFKNVLANIVAILLILLSFIFIFMIFISFSIFKSDSSIEIKENSILVIDSNTFIIDSPTESMQDVFSFNENSEVLIYDVIRSIKEAKYDDNVKGISLEFDKINAGITHISDLRNALLDFKKSGKFIYAYGNGISQKSYYLSSLADKFYLNPVGGIELKGMSTEVVFFKNFADKLGVGIQVIRHGKYKSAVEPYLTNEISSENKEQLSVLLNDIWGNISSDIQKSRKINSNDFKIAVDSLYGIIPDLAFNHKLVDKLIQKSEYDDILKSKLKIDKKADINKLSIASYIKNKVSSSINSNENIAVLYASGAINDGEGYNGIYDENLIREIKSIKEDESIKGVVLRVNSPGGSSNASDQILFELDQLSKVKPLVVSFGDYAASGGYYIAMAGERIFSEPNTITGSIGVFGVVPNAKNLANKNGIRSDVVATNENANFYSPIQGLSSGAEAVMSKSVEMTYKRFVHFVSKNRKKTFQQIDQIGGGRVWSGTRAKEIGLVDELGSLNDAIEYLAKKVNVSKDNVVQFPAKKSKLELILNDLDGENITTKIIEKKIGKDYIKWIDFLSNSAKPGQVIMVTPYNVEF